jgi:hypothetical protein
LCNQTLAFKRGFCDQSELVVFRYAPKVRPVEDDRPELAEAGSRDHQGRNDSAGCGEDDPKSAGPNSKRTGSNGE